MRIDKVLKFNSNPQIHSVSSVVGVKEFSGPLSEYYDLHFEDTKAGQSTWEKAESEFVRQALEISLKKAFLKDESLDIIFAGDLINQCTVSTFGILSHKIPLLGLYGACSTYAEGMLLASAFVNAGYATNAACLTSSHFCTAERQYRFPIEYACQRTPTAQNTVTGSGAMIINTENKSDSPIYIKEGMIGIPIDMGITDANNMGAAMAPAAAETIIRYFKATQTTEKDYDLILTGDLGWEGHNIMKELLKNESINAGSNFNDCGILIYDRKRQDMHAGGSGCGCSAVVFNSYIMEQLSNGYIKNVLFIGTGALLSPLSVMQGYPIPGIAHLLNISTQK